MKGTGTHELFESTVVDKYIKLTATEGADFKIYSQELWDFLVTKYEGNEVKRYYISLGTLFSQVELKLKSIPIIILPTDQLLKGELSEIVW